MRKILIADDNTEMLARQKSFLVVRDFEVFTMTSPAKIMALARELQPDLVVLDFEMEEMNAEDVCRRLKQHDSTESIPVMITTSHEPERIKRGCLLAGAKAVVRKTEKRDGLLRSIIQVFGLPQRSHARTSCDFRVGISDVGTLTEGVAQNISQSGLYLTVRKILRGGASLRLNFQLPGAAGSVEILGEVVRIETLVGGHYGYGIQFLEMDADSLQELKDFAARHAL